jgi:hypothetical protein
MLLVLIFVRDTGEREGYTDTTGERAFVQYSENIFLTELAGLFCLSTEPRGSSGGPSPAATQMHIVTCVRLSDPPTPTPKNERGPDTKG